MKNYIYYLCFLALIYLSASIWGQTFNPFIWSDSARGWIIGSSIFGYLIMLISKEVDW